MPELPEVETIRRDLMHDIKGKRIADVEVLAPKLTVPYAGEPGSAVCRVVEDLLHNVEAGTTEPMNLDAGTVGLADYLSVEGSVHRPV